MKSVFVIYCSIIFYCSYSFGQLPELHINAKEYLYLHTDRDYYVKGSTIFFKAYLTDQTKLLGSSKSGLIYVELINQYENIVDRKIVPIEGGIGLGSFSLESINKGGSYVLRAYTNYMRNYGDAKSFKKLIFISDNQNVNEKGEKATEDIIVRLLPEGGNLVNGLESNLILKTTNNEGKGVSCQVSIISTNNELFSLSTDEDGFGEARIVPDINEKYSITVNKKSYDIDFPIILEEGIVLSVDTNPDHFTINVNATTFSRDGFVVIYNDTEIIHKDELVKNKISKYSFEFGDLPPGVIHISVYDKTGIGISERLVFNNNGVNNYNVDISFDKDQYGKRALVGLGIDLYDDNGESLSGNYSISIVDSYLNKRIANNDNISSYFFLNTQLAEALYEPTVYLDNSNDSIYKIIDKLMLVNGWRRFIGNKSSSQAFSYEQENIIFGKVYKGNNKMQTTSSSGIMYVFDDILNSVEFNTDDNGDFSINHSLYGDSIQVFFKLGDYSKKKQNGNRTFKVNKKLNLTIDKDSIPDISEEINRIISNFHFVDNTDIDIKSVLKYQDIIEQSNFRGYSISENIEEVVITAESVDDHVEIYKNSMLYTKPNTRIFAQDLPLIHQYLDVYDLLRGRVAGMQLDAPDIPGIKHTIILRGRSTDLTKSTSGIKMSNSARFMINGSFVPTRLAESISPSQIAFVDVISSLGQLSLYGEQGYNGIVNIYLKKFNKVNKPWSNSDDTDLISKIVSGYHQSREFYHPDYQLADADNQSYDSRITLFWKPNLIVDDSGSAYVEFYTADRHTIYDIVIEGITDSGLPVSSRSQLSVSQ